MNPYAEVDFKTSGGSDSYNALQTQLSRRFRMGLTMNAQYTFGKSTGTTAGSTFGLLRQTVERTVGLGTNRQTQFALRLNF